MEDSREGAEVEIGFSSPIHDPVLIFSRLVVTDVVFLAKFPGSSRSSTFVVIKVGKRAPLKVGIEADPGCAVTKA